MDLFPGISISFRISLKKSISQLGKSSNRHTLNYPSTSNVRKIEQAPSSFSASSAATVIDDWRRFEWQLMPAKPRADVSP